MGEYLLEVQDLKTYFKVRAGRVRAVDGVSFGVKPGEKVGIVGESGCGKSVTALSIMRLLPKPAGEYAGGSMSSGIRTCSSFLKKRCAAFAAAKSV